MSKRTLIAILIAGGALFSPRDGKPQTAGVPQFTLVVPVQLTNLHESVTSASMYCCLKLATGAQPFAGVSQAINIAPACVGCPPSDFVGNVTLHLSVPAGSTVKPDELTQYHCALSVNGTPAYTAYGSGSTIAIQPKPGTVWKPNADGPVYP